MIKIYLSKSNITSRKVKDWLTAQGLEFEEIDWHKYGMTRSDFYKILSLTENGTEEIISQRSHIYPDFYKALPALTLADVFSWVCSHRSLLRLPLILDERRLLVGYSSDQIRIFLTRQTREVEMKKLKSLVNKEL
ncbi:Spx/MgsR family RNA polymerase-binding regulatory protein [Lactococcus petauri]|nr:Spx/MgsR family RNA polymerase-binding regulatory protein [Lactococcus petauri]